MIFLESTKDDKIVERQLTHLDKFTYVKRYHDFDDEIPHLEGGYLSWINLRNLLLKYHFPVMKNIQELHYNKEFNWKMKLRGVKG